MKLAVDSSSFAKRYINEPGSEQLDEQLRNASGLGLCVILFPEIISGLNRRLREKVLTQMQYRMVKTQLMDDVRDAIILQLTPAVIARAVTLLERNKLRAMDALHIACAMEWKSDLFLTSDKQQFVAANHTGLSCEFIG